MLRTIDLKTGRLPPQHWTLSSMLAPTITYLSRTLPSTASTMLTSPGWSVARSPTMLTCLSFPVAVSLEFMLSKWTTAPVLKTPRPVNQCASASTSCRQIHSATKWPQILAPTELVMPSHSACTPCASRVRPSTVPVLTVQVVQWSTPISPLKSRPSSCPPETTLTFGE